MNVLLGVTGSIAAYKAAEVVSSLRKAGVNTTVVMTENATRLVGPATFRSLSGNPVRVDMWEEVAGKPIHIAMAAEPDVIAVVPATANIIGRIANGICDDLLSTVLISTRAPVVLAPAMNENMYLNPVVQDNIRKLRDRGYLFVEPERGWLACGVEGVGRLADPETIVKAILDAAKSNQGDNRDSSSAANRRVGPDPRADERSSRAKATLAGKKVVITGGPTREPIDAVRFISNRSSGKMAVALAEAARLRGAETVLISGPRSAAAPAGVKVVDVETADEMRRAIECEWDDADCIVMAAAVCDFKPDKVLSGKLRRGSSLNLKLVSTEDIVANLAKDKGARVVVGFALEIENEVEAGKAKLAEKNLDLVFVNNPRRDGCGFGSDTNAGYLLDGDGRVEEIPLTSKTDVAGRIIDAASALFS
jgi:phosphopantothenoylcysteine decarboxylase/phosphopantothenate--cysteine ligase